MRNRHEKEVVNDYREWLVAFVDTPKRDFQKYYTNLIDILFTTPFRWKVKRDQDRYADGLYLRKRYLDETLIDIDKDLMPECSVLEFLVALFVRYSDTVLTEPGDDSVAPDLFYDAIAHLNLLFFDDEKHDFEGVYDTLERLMDCKILLFPVSFSKKSEGFFLQVSKYSMEKWQF